MDNFLEKLSEIFNKCVAKIKKLFTSAKNGITGLFSGKKAKSASDGHYVYTNRENDAHTVHLSSSREKKDSGNILQKIKDWFGKLSQPAIIGIVAGAVVVIAVPIILACTLPKKASETTADAQTENVYRSVDDDSQSELYTTEIGTTAIEGGETDDIIPEEEAEDEPAFDPLSVDTAELFFGLGGEAEIVPPIQERLMELDYMDEDEPTEVYNRATYDAVKLFKRDNGLGDDGIMDGETFLALFSEDAKKYELHEGSEGEDVTSAQQRLYELGYIESVTGYFGTDTASAVERFQELNELAVDGKIGAETKAVLYSENVKYNYLSYGASGDVVTKYQNRLKKLGYLASEADGKLGSDTVEAIKLFQENNGLTADGYLGPTTKELLMSDDAEAYVLKLGASGDYVTMIQERLKELKYLSKVTGYYGSDTVAAVKAFQQRNDLSDDGKMGGSSITKLFSSDARKAKSQTKKSSSSGGSSDSGSSGTSYVANGANVSSLISVAKSRLGCRYVKGGKGPTKFDCSGFVYWCLKEIGFSISYMTSSDWASCGKYPKITNIDDVQAGDICCFRGHVGIALGDGTMIDASSSSGQIRITSLSKDYWHRNWRCAYRPL